MREEIEEYIEENDLDDVQNAEEIKKHFEQYSQFIGYGQAVLISIEKFALKVYEEYKY